MVVSGDEMSKGSSCRCLVVGYIFEPQIMRINAENVKRDSQVF